MGFQVFSEFNNIIDLFNNIIDLFNNSIDLFNNIIDLFNNIIDLFKISMVQPSAGQLEPWKIILRLPKFMHRGIEI